MPTTEKVSEDEVFKHLFEITREACVSFDDNVLVKKEKSTKKVRPAKKKKTKVQIVENLIPSVGKKSPVSSKKDVDLSLPLDLSISSKKKKSKKPTTNTSDMMMPWMPQQLIDGNINFMTFLNEMKKKLMGNPN